MKKKKIVAQNIVVVMFTQAIRMILTFVVRTFFVKYLGEVFLGYNSVFTNLLSLLNLTELGIGVAIVSFMYKPMLEDDKETVNALMWIYRKVYMVIGACILVVGVVLSFFLPIIISDSIHEDIYIKILFYIYLIGTAASYLLAYKRNYLIAIEKNYIVALCDSFTEIIFSVLQIWVLCVYGNYVFYIIAQVSKTFVANIIISVFVEKKIGVKVHAPQIDIVEEYKTKIITFVKDIFISKIGGYVFNSTDAIVCSFALGIIITGKFDNYVFIYTAIQSIIVLIFNAIQSSYGYYIHSTPELDKQERMFTNYELACFLIGTICMFGLFFLQNPLIKMWFGEQYVLEPVVAAIMGVNILLNMFIQLLSQAFTIYQLYHYDRKIVCISAISNIVISYLLACQIGVVGIVLGTTITSCIYIVTRLYVIYKHVFELSLKKQIKQIMQFVVGDIVLGTILYTLLKDVVINSFWGLMAYGVFIVVIVGIFLLLICSRKI